MLQKRSSRSRSLGWYMEQITHYPGLTREEESLLVAGLGTDPEDPSRMALVHTHLHLVVHVAKRLRNPHLPLEDLIAEGNVGLLWAARRFEPHRGTRFVTYAIWWVRKAILEALDRNTGAVRIPQYRKRAIQQACEHLDSQQGKSAINPGRGGPPGHMKLTSPEVEVFLAMRKPALSLDLGRNQDGKGPLLEILVNSEAPDPHKRMEQDEARHQVRLGLNRLRSLDQFVLVRRYGLDGDEPWTLEETGQELRVSRERIRQIEFEAKKRLRRILALPRLPARRSPEVIAS